MMGLYLMKVMVKYCFWDQGDSLETVTKCWFSSPFMPIQTEERLWIKVIFSRHLVSPGNSLLSMSLR